MAELRDLYDKNSNKTDKTYHKGDVIPKGYYPMVVMVVIRNSKGEFLMQKRVEEKGGDWGVTGGHPKSGETPIEGMITEVKEELGLDFSKEDFIEYDSGCDGKDCYKMYFVTKDIDLKDITIQKEELTEVRWFSMNELQHMVEIKELNDDQIACFVKVCNYLKNEKNSIISEVEKYVKEKIEEYKNNSEDHYDFWNEHIKYVYEESLKLADEYNADKEIVALGALLHDIALINKVGDRKDHHINGEKIAREVLTNLNYDEAKKERVLKCVYNHRSSKNTTSIEELCVGDADILAHFDNIPMLFNSAFTRYNVPLSEIRDWLKDVFEKEYNDLSDRTKERFKDRYKQISEIIVG